MGVPYLDIKSTVVYLILSLLLFQKHSIAQNLIPNAGFENIKPGATCGRPDVSFENLEQWYSLNLNPDLFNSACDFNETDFIYWSESTNPPQGANYTGIWSRWNSDETYKSEGIAIELIEPLAAGETYLLEMQIFNRGEFQGLTGTCILKPNKHIDVYLLEDSIKIENNFSNGTATTNGVQVASLASAAVTSDETEDWQKISTCFTAAGGETFLGLILPLGDFGELPPCVGTMGTSGVFRSFYYFIDDLQLSVLSTDLSLDTLICEGQELMADLTKIFKDDLLDQATFTWDDNDMSSFRILPEPRSYQIDAATNCGIIPLELNISTESCDDLVFVPNVFNPNSDNVNRMLSPMNINSDAVSNYRFSIFDRWGSPIFETTNPSASWDGSSRNQALPTGIYIWSLSYDIIELNVLTTKTSQGTITLIR